MEWSVISLSISRNRLFLFFIYDIIHKLQNEKCIDFMYLLFTSFYDL